MVRKDQAGKTADAQQKQASTRALLNGGLAAATSPPKAPADKGPKAARCVPLDALSNAHSNPDDDDYDAANVSPWSGFTDDDDDAASADAAAAADASADGGPNVFNPAMAASLAAELANHEHPLPAVPAPPSRPPRPTRGVAQPSYVLEDVDDWDSDDSLPRSYEAYY